MLGRTAPDVTISDFEYCGCLNKILKSIIANNRHIDPITARQEQKFINLANELCPKARVISVVRSAHPASEAGYRLADAIENVEIAGHPRDKGVDAENKPGWVSRF